ncbi:MAG: hydrolase, partial [Gammaproteobacteria bacterium]|nr:hydrolase [Gammaproteobacteria bacterium]
MFRRRPRLTLRRERLELPDGDFLDLAWSGPERGPLVLVLHGLEGSLRSHYAASLIDGLVRAGLGVVFMHFRNCGGEPNRLPRSYHSGETGDLDQRGDSAPVRTAVAVSVPFLLGEAAERMETGWSRLYQWQLVRSLRRSYRRKLPRLAAHLPVDATELERLRTFRTFDDRVTAPLHGFAGVDDYYTRSSSRQFLRHIRRP